MLATALESLRLPGVTVDSDYQLTVEDADAAARHDVVVFADAAATGSEPFYFRRIAASGGCAFSSHAVEPGEVLTLAETLFKKTPEAYALGIRGYEFGEFGEGLSGRAAANLARAVEFAERVIRAEAYAASECGAESGDVVT
jgi:hydrogenase maturation protease